MESQKDIEKILHAKHLLALNLYRFSQSDEFQAAYKIANNEQKIKLIANVTNYDYIVAWTKDILKCVGMYELLDVKTLKEIAQARGIPYTSSMKKLELLSALQQIGASKDDHKKIDSRVILGNEGFINDNKIWVNRSEELRQSISAS